MPLSDYLIGAAELAAVLAAVMAGAILLVRRAGPLTRPEHALATALVATAALVAVHVVPAALGVLSPITTLLAAAAWLAIAWRLRVPASEAPPGPRGAPRSPLASRVLAYGTTFGLGAVALAIVTRDRLQASGGLDMVNFHLPGVARWIQRSSIWDIHQFGPDLAHGNYPHNGDFVFLAATLPWENDFLVRLTMVPFWALTALAVYVVARELNAPATTAALAGAAVVSVPEVLEASLHEGLPDAVLYFTFTTGIAFLLRHHRTQARSDLLLGGLGLAIAFGTKWYGVAACAIILAVWTAASLLGRTRPRVVLARLAALTALVTAGGAAWLLRNWIESGNPFFPVKVEAAGVTIFDAPFDPTREYTGFAVVEYLGDGEIWREHLLPIYRDFLALPALALGVLALVALATSLGRRAGDRRVTALGVAAVLLATLYVVLPYSAQGGPGLPFFAGFNTRYLVPALLCCAPLAAWLPSRFPRARLPIELLLAAAVVDGIGQRLEVPVARSLAVAFVLALAAVVATVAWRSRDALGGRGARAAAALAAVVALIAVVAEGHHTQRGFNDRRYAGFDATFDWVRDNAPRDHRIALANEWSRGVGAPFPMFGPRLKNEVEYIGYWDRGMLRRYLKEEPFMRAFREGDYDLLIVGRSSRAAPGAPPAYLVPEERWAKRAGLEQVARSDTFTLFRRPAP